MSNMPQRTRKSIYDASDLDIFQDGETVNVCLSYPPYENTPNPEGRCRYVEVELCAVRAADNVRISYDFGRNGWSIQQAAVFEWSGDDPVCDPEWAEVAFVPAWQRQRVPPRPEEKQ